MRRLTAGGVLLALALTVPTYTGAQVSGVAFASHSNGSILEGFIGPWRPTPAGMDIQYVVLCYDTLQTPRKKVGGEVTVAIPDGTTLGGIRVLSTTAIVNACADQGVTVPRGAVILPAVQLGQ